MALTFLTSIPAALILYDSILNDTDYIVAAGDDTGGLATCCGQGPDAMLG